MGGAWARKARWVPGDLLCAARHGVIWMLTMYPKNVVENISAHVLRQIKKEVDDG